MDKTLFFTLGPALVVAALLLSAIGLRAKDFPSRGAMAGVLSAFVALVVGVMVFSVLNAESEPLGDENREASKAEQVQGEEHAVQEADNPGAPEGGEAQPPAAQKTAPPGKTTTLKVTSPADGALSFDPATLSAKPGGVTLDYTNPSPVPHDIAIEDASGAILDETQPAADTSFTVSVALKPGDYVYFCNVPGHREGGMEGTLTVK
jgi:plastocyanin